MTPWEVSIYRLGKKSENFSQIMGFWKFICDAFGARFELATQKSSEVDKSLKNLQNCEVGQKY